ncbi:phage major tail tube protein [Chitinimonas koreensis]|uniref:phage major tail tube protein n=1 Tax=Chitinimonas koreensis TaxID=356302 RepID=UPI000402A2B6|nr:phage major tail tube protein [Chitinimonas koreensis]QNM96396.1 phage major tail tube protein [Chitinimonas koreensis]
MALPNKLKYFDVFTDGNNHGGEVKEITLPKLARKMEDWRAGGMDGSIKVDLGQEPLELELTFGGVVRDALSAYAATTHDAVLLRFVGAYQREDVDNYDAIEIEVRGRYQEIDMGTAKAGDENDFKAKLPLSYYRLAINGATVIEIDNINFVHMVDGVDRLAKARKALGR